MKWLKRAARELNWARRSWSTATDREFHEELYRIDNYDPFSWEYPGYTTIRRFADLVEPHLPPRGLVVDLGCGPGEITCELASRRPDLSFLGIDHSHAAIEKAHTNIGRRRVANARFERMNVEEYAPPEEIALVTLFDSFHHLVTPREFVRRLSPRVARWVLIEPRGDWTGRWRKDIDFDWLSQDLDKIRARVAASLGTARAAGSPVDAPSTDVGLAVERRYTPDDFHRFFEGCALDFRGTVAGLESYPPGSNHGGELRERFGELRYQLYRDIDDWLFEQNLDLHAKHWLVVAERGGRSRVPEPSPLATAHLDSSHVTGQYDVRYGAYRGPLASAPGERLFGVIALTNEGWETWTTGANAIFASYHWLDEHGRVVQFDGERTPLPRAIRPGETCDVALAVHAPAEVGRYQLAIDLVREGVTWFSEAGHPWLAQPFEVRSAP